MPFPRPVPGLVVRYSYLWTADHRRGREEGVKDRPCAIILVTTAKANDEVVTVLPITHSPPIDLRFAVEIPYATKHRLRLDSERSWVILSEANRFLWPGPDLRPLDPGDASTAAYGLLPYGLTEIIRLKFITVLKERRARWVTRTD